MPNVVKRFPEKILRLGYWFVVAKLNPFLLTADATPFEHPPTLWDLFRGRAYLHSYDKCTEREAASMQVEQ